MLVDTHCHLTTPELHGRLDEVLHNAREAGVRRMILVAQEPTDALHALEIIRDRPYLFLIAGVHPHEAGKCDEDTLGSIASLLRGEGLSEPLRARVVAVGETGLDFHYDFAPPERQEAVLRAQLDLAVEVDKPVVIHARESEHRVCDVLAEYPPLAGRVVFHCFSGDTNLARRALDLGCYLSYTGVVTFKKAASIQASARYTPADRIMVETDAPFLSPEPVRKIRPNEPALLVHTARFLAALRGESYEDFAAASTANAERFFKLGEE